MTKDASGNLEIRNSYAHNLGDAFVKKNQGTGTLRVRNVHAVLRDSWVQNGNLEKPQSNGNYCFYAVPKNQDEVGTIDVEHLWVENLAETFVHYSQDGGGTIQGAGPIRVERANLVNRKGRDSGFFIDTVTSKTHLNIGRLSVHDVRNDDGIFNFTSGTADGAIDELYRRSDSVIGETDEASINADNPGSTPLTITVPSTSEVGALQGSDSSTTLESHVLEVAGKTDTTYTVTVTGDAQLGSNSDPMDGITTTDEGYSMIEGTVLAGGLDSYRFTGDVLKAESTIEGDAIVSVDGTEVDMTGENETVDGFASYERPEQGALEWHVPINENFEQISSDVQHLAARLDDLESQIN